VYPKVCTNQRKYLWIDPETGRSGNNNFQVLLNLMQNQ
jgi:hypothetical protein